MAIASSRFTTVILITIAMGLALHAPAQAAQRGGILRVTHRENPPSASIHEEATISTVMPFMAVFNNLVVFDPATKQDRLDAIVPDLAKAWSWDETRTRLTFKLNEAVRWHDGVAFTAKDVKCTWDMITGKTDNKLRKNPRKSWYFNLNEVSTNGDYEVTFALGRPQPSFLAYLASGFSPVYPCHVQAAQMRTKPIGTGPFKLTDFKQNEKITLTRNATYWKPELPYLDGIEYTIITSRSTMMLSFITGAQDMTFTSEVTPALMKDVLAQAPQAQCEMLPTYTLINLLVNRDKPPFDNPQIRKAMGLALDRRAFIQILSQGVDEVGAAMLPPPNGTWGAPPAFIETIEGYNPDIERSREQGRALMRALGYGPDNPLKLKVTTRNIALYRDPAVILTDQLKSVHIDSELDVLDSGVWYARLARKDFSVGLNVQGVGVDDPDVVFYETFSCNSERNYTNFCDPGIEKLFHEQSALADIETRRKLVWEIDKKLQEDGARPVISHLKGGTCWQPHVKGINLAVNTIYNRWRFETTWLEK